MRPSEGTRIQLMTSRTTPPRLLDTQLLIWMAFAPEQLPSKLIPDLEDRQQRFFVSVVSLWEAAIKRSLNRPVFQFDAAELRQQLQREGFEELPIRAEHCLAVQNLPWHHKDPFDRLLIAQAQQEQIQLLSCDQSLSQYGACVTLLRR